ncbi:MAG: hypothetical protein HY678_02555, partial [Chloroflexi bacterium]|nr:hypothetical protein [Chloroflexota bacterium]
AGTYFPETPKALFRFCRYYYYTVGIIGAAVDVHAAYPVTDIVVDDDDKDLRAKWGSIVNEQFKLKSFLVEAGKDYVTFGNSFISLHIPFQRWLICPDCRHKEPIETITYEFKNFVFQGPCKDCGHSVRYQVEDVTIRDLKRVNLIRWSPENIDIEYNPITGDHVYRYSIPNDIRRYVALGRRHIIERIPLVFIEAIRDHQPIIFNPKNIYHLKRPALAEKNMGWGEPALIRVLKDTYYLMVLRKAREAVAHQHIVPLWVLFPQPHGELNPYEHLNLAEWRGRLEEEIKKWRQDPNYIPIMPIPLGFQFIGGTFKSLDTTPEVQNLLLNILAGMNMPQEFIYGGLQYSGTSFSIRMLANLFSSYRSQMLEFINGFFIPRISETFSIRAVKCHFTDLKLADDVQKKTLLLSLNQQNKLSTSTLLSELGLDAAMELGKVKEEMKEQGEILARQMVAQERARADAMMENVRGQIRAQLMQQQIAGEVQQEMASQNINIDTTRELRINPKLWESLFKADTTHPYYDESGRPFFVINPVSIPETVASLAKALEAANKRRQAEILSELQSSMPVLYELVQGQMQAQLPAAGKREALPRPKIDMRPMPAEKPPRRAGSGG